MGQFLGSWDLDDVLRVYVQTSSVTTGAATDADAAPTWRVYEDDTATPVTTGSFATLNAQTGFYVAAITLAAAIGYEIGRQYAIRKQATVGGIIGADVDTFQIQSEVRLAAGAITAGTITAGALQGFTLGSVAGTVGSVATAVTVGATSQAAIVDGVWDETGADHTSAGSFGARLNVTINSMTAGAIGPVSLTAGAITAGVITNGAFSAAKFAADAIAALTTVGSTAVSAIQDGLATQASVDTIDNFLDTEIAAIQAKTDQLTFNSGSVAANVLRVNGTSITGNGQSGTEWGPGS